MQTRAREVCFHDLAFRRVPMACKTPRGASYTRWVGVGMPRIRESMLDSTFFLYPSREDAEAGNKCGGTGFLVAYPSELFPNEITYLYGVTNWHVAVRDGASVIRLNTIDGKTDTIDHGPDEWVFDEAGDDLAAIFVQVDEGVHRTAAIPIDLIKRQSDFYANKWAPIGVGDDVFMLGRFVDVDSTTTNKPTARFGCISAMPLHLKQPTGRTRESYLLDMHSRTGYSGSPVFVYRTPGTNIAQALEVGQYDLNKSLLCLLGVHFGQFDDFDQDGVVIGKSAMTAAVPAENILGLLEAKIFVEMRRSKDAKWAAKLMAEKFQRAPSAESAGSSVESTHREDFNNLLDAAVRGKPSDS